MEIFSPADQGEPAVTSPKPAGSRPKRPKSRPGRVESGLDRELVERGREAVRPAARAALRAQARAVDVAEGNRDPDAVSTANRVYLEMRLSEGLGPVIENEGDTFAQLLAEIGRAETDTRDRPDA
jgi:hypothetical protein